MGKDNTHTACSKRIIEMKKKDQKHLEELMDLFNEAIEASNGDIEAEEVYLKQHGVEFIPTYWATCAGHCTNSIWTATKPEGEEKCVHCGKKAKRYI